MINRTLKSPTREVVRTNSAIGKPKFKKGKSPLSGFRGLKKPKLFRGKI